MIEALMASACVIIVIAGCSWIGGLIVFAPLHERTLLFQVRNRFRIADVLSLGVLLQVAVGIVLALTPADSEAAPRIVLSIIVSLIVTGWWINGLRMLSRAGVESGIHRAAFLILVLPSGYVCILLVLATIVMFPAAMELLTNVKERASWEIALAIFLLVLPVAGVVWGIICHRVCRRMADRARDEQAKRDGIEFDEINQSERDPAVTKYLIGRQGVRQNGIWLDDPVVMATSADPIEEVEGVQLLDPNETTSGDADEAPPDNGSPKRE